MKNEWIQRVEDKRLSLGLTQLWQMEKALRINNFNVTSFRKMFDGNFLSQMKCVLDGRARITGGYEDSPKKPVISPLQAVQEQSKKTPLVNLFLKPSLVDGLRVVEHKLQEPIRFNSVTTLLYVTHKQRNGRVVTGADMLESLQKIKVFNANMLDFLLKPKYQHLIPVEWKRFYVFFWGTIYSSLVSERQCVRGLCYGPHGWESCVHYLDQGWSPVRLALVPAMQRLNSSNVASLNVQGLGEYHLVDRRKVA